MSSYAVVRMPSSPSPVVLPFVAQPSHLTTTSGVDNRSIDNDARESLPPSPSLGDRILLILEGKKRYVSSNEDTKLLTQIIKNRKYVTWDP
ncbi:hypothetical protein CDL12_19715 [Handroanthus impetiginosus]|uniref:Uncharacterized protein n=1 Tax=Handroanthus impetiginosus TaxID=429701 RepID=A0A2G9GRT6_9LAMI|nr:hypothetical protein CDL12_19715 [Handroanthus impetiginosus]